MSDMEIKSTTKRSRTGMRGTSGVPTATTREGILEQMEEVKEMARRERTGASARLIARRLTELRIALEELS